MSLIIKYAIIGFRPNWHNKEFINVGVIAIESQSRYLSFKLLSSKKTKRIKHCFPNINIDVYKNGIDRLLNELYALKIELNGGNTKSKNNVTIDPSQSDFFSSEDKANLFDEITIDQNSTLFISLRGTQVSNDIDNSINNLYNSYIENIPSNYLDQEEQKLTKKIRRLLSHNNLGKLYKELTNLGTDLYHVSIPFTFKLKNKNIPIKAIKPLNLSQNTTTKIYTYGDTWVAKIKRLDQINFLPKEFLFVVKMPEGLELKKAAEDICSSLSEFNVKVLNDNQLDEIVDFARNKESKNLVLTP